MSDAVMTLDPAPEDTLDAATPPVNRMAIAAVSLVGVFVSIYLLLYKVGVLGSLACGVAGGCATVQASRYALFLGVPVAAWGLVGYLAILALALAGMQPRWIAARPVAAGLLALTAVALAFSLYLTYLEAYVIRAWCRWCLVSLGLVVLLFVLALPELRRTRAAEPAGA